MRLIALVMGAALVGFGIVAIVATIDLMPPASYWCGLGIVAVSIGALMLWDE